VANCIDGFYNCARLHSVLSNLPPTVYERAKAEEELIVVSENTLLLQRSSFLKRHTTGEMHFQNFSGDGIGIH
jgi:hypothetical protein